MMEIETRIAGIPCLIEVGYIEPYEPAYTRGHPDNWEPESGGVIEFNVLDRRGRPAPWLERKLTDDIISDIETQILKEYENESDY